MSRKSTRITSYNVCYTKLLRVIAASGTLAQIIPPSLVLIVLADQLGLSVGDMYAGALIPGLMLMVFYAVFIFIVTLVRPAWVPALPPEARTLKGGKLVITSYSIHYTKLYDQGCHSLWGTRNGEDTPCQSSG